MTIPNNSPFLEKAIDSIQVLEANFVEKKLNPLDMDYGDLMSIIGMYTQVAQAEVIWQVVRQIQALDRTTSELTHHVKDLAATIKKKK